MEGWDIVLPNDAKTIVHVPFPNFEANGWNTYCGLFDLLHAKIGNNGAEGTAHRTAMDLFINSLVEHKIVVGQGELKKFSDVIDVQICPWRKGGILFKFLFYVHTSFIYRNCGEEWHNIKRDQNFTIINLENCKELATEYPLRFWSGERISVRNLDVLYSAEPIQVTMGLRGFPSLWCLTEPRIAGGVPSVEWGLRYVGLSIFCCLFKERRNNSCPLPGQYNILFNKYS